MSQYGRFTDLPNGQPQAQQEMVIVSSMPATMTTERSEAWSWCSLVTAMFSMCCCQLLGFIATVLAILSYVDHRVKQFDASKAKRQVSYGLSIAAFAIGLIVIIVIIVIIVKAEETATDIYDKAASQATQDWEWDGNK